MLRMADGPCPCVISCARFWSAGLSLLKSPPLSLAFCARKLMEGVAPESDGWEPQPPVNTRTAEIITTRQRKTGRVMSRRRKRISPTSPLRLSKEESRCIRWERHCLLFKDCFFMDRYFSEGVPRPAALEHSELQIGICAVRKGRHFLRPALS